MQQSQESLLYEDHNPSFFSQIAGQNTSISDLKFSSNNPTYIENNESKQMNEWTPVVERIFSLSEFNLDFSDGAHAGAKNIKKASGLDQVESIINVDKKECESISVNIIRNLTEKECECMQRFNITLLPSNHEGAVILSTFGGEFCHKKRKSLESMHLQAAIKKVKIKLLGSGNYVKLLSRAIHNIMLTGIFTDWLFLKCETTKIEFRRLSKEVTIHSTDSLVALRSAVYHNSCLPLPLIIKNKNNLYQYFYFVFNYGNNPNILKLHTCLFDEDQYSDSEIQQGIKLHDSYVRKLDMYTFCAEPGFEYFMRKNESTIRRLIFFHHMVWGFLQCWVRKTVKLYKFMLTVEEVASQLALCHVAAKDVQELKDAAARTQTLYLIGFCKDYFLYLKLFTLKVDYKIGYSISIANVEPDLVSEVSIIQYFHQYFFINHSNQLTAIEAIANLTSENSKNITDSETNCRPISKPRDDMYFTTNPVNVVVEAISNIDSVSANYNRGQKEIKTFRHLCENPMARHSVIPMKNPQPLKPLIKARTVEEINSSVENLGIKESSSLWRMNKDLEECYIIKTLLESGKISRNEIKFQLLPLVRSSLDLVYAMNTSSISEKDETVDETFIRNCFIQAVSAADKTKTFEVFLEQVFRILQLHFTNYTCQRIMDLMIYEDLRTKYAFCHDSNHQQSLPDSSNTVQFVSTLECKKSNLFNKCIYRKNVRKAFSSEFQNLNKCEHDGAELMKCSSEIPKTKPRPRFTPCFIVLDRREVEDYLKRRRKLENKAKSCDGAKSAFKNFHGELPKPHVKKNEKPCLKKKPSRKAHPSRRSMELVPSKNHSTEELHEKRVFKKLFVVLTRLEHLIFMNSNEAKARVKRKSNVSSGIGNVETFDRGGKEKVWLTREKLTVRNTLKKIKNEKTESRCVAVDSETVALLREWKCKKKPTYYFTVHI